MNKILYTLLGVLMLATAGCRREQTYHIGVSQCSSDDWRMEMNEEIEREVMLHPEVKVEIRSADDSSDKQIADIRYFLDNKFDIIIAAPNEADALTPIIAEAYRSGTPVIVFDRNIHGDTYTAFQGADNAAIGRDAARYARSLAGGEARVLEVYGLPTSTPAIDRHKGFVEEYGLPKTTVYGDWNADGAARAVDSALTADKDYDIIYAHNDRMAIAARRVAERHGINPYIIGIDAAPNIGIQAVADGDINATFVYPTEGHRLIRTALSILKGEPFDTISKLPSASAVDHTNADILLLQNSQLGEETEKIVKLKSQVDEYMSLHQAQSWLFYAALAIVLLLSVLLFTILRTYWQNRAHQEELERSNAQLAAQADELKSLNERLESATQSKLAFFTNVSHDLRTPLTLVAEPVQVLAEADNLSGDQRTLARLAAKNVKILLRLINQILDFRKFENGKVDVNLEETDLRPAMADWTDAFSNMARKRGIRLSVDIDAEGDMHQAIDTEKMERVVYNLISNAFKYTPAGGDVRVSCRRQGNEVVIKVGDTGSGIPPEDLPKIFDRFYQVDHVRARGTGIGLALVKAFVELHGGTISVESRVGVGTEFEVRLPVRHVDHDAASVPRITADAVDGELGIIEPDPAQIDPSKPLLLVIDDNADIRVLMRQLLKDTYNIIAVGGGADGIRAAARYVPDAIICDVMMPDIDGLEVCRRIKGELSTSHIPVLMLTACSLDEQRASGYESGADGYLAKPFDPRVLLTRIASLIENRKRIKEIFATTKHELPGAAPAAETAAAKAPVDDIDSEFYARFVQLVNQQMSNPDLNVENIAQQMSLGRSQFYRKIKSLTNYSPVELLRNLRLKKARELLTTTEKSVSEIGYEVGFSTPAYFTKCYREAYGETPSALRNRICL